MSPFSRRALLASASLGAAGLAIAHSALTPASAQAACRPRKVIGTFGPASMGAGARGACVIGTTLFVATRLSSPPLVGEINLDTGELIDTIRIEDPDVEGATGGSGAWHVAAAPDGSAFYVAVNGSAWLYRCTLADRSVQAVAKIGEASTVGYSLAVADDGKVFVGTYPAAAAMEYDPVTGQTRTAFTTPAEDQQTYARLSVDDTHVYVGGITHSKIYAVDRTTGESRNITPDGATGGLQAIRAEDGIVHAGFAAEVWRIDTSDGSVVKTPLEAGDRLIDAFGLGADGEVYGTARPSTTVYRSDEHGLTEIAQPGAQDESSLVTRLADGRFVGVHASGRFWVGPADDITVTELPDIGFATPESAQVIGRAPDGKIWVGGHFAMTVHDTEAGTQERFRVVGEPKTIDFAANGDAWIVVYPGVEVIKVSPELEITSYGKVSGQYRPREAAWVEESQQLVVATRSGVGTFNGAVSVVDAAAGTIETYAGLLPDQGIESVQVHEGVAWITGDTRPENQVGPAPYAEIGAFDLSTRKLLWRDGLDQQNLSIENLHVFGDRIFVGCRRPNGRQLVLDRTTRAIVAEHQVHGYGEIDSHQDVVFIYSNFSDEIVALGGRGVPEPVVLHTELEKGWYNPPVLAFVPGTFQTWGLAGLDLALYDIDPRCRS